MPEPRLIRAKFEFIKNELNRYNEKLKADPTNKQLKFKINQLRNGFLGEGNNDDLLYHYKSIIPLSKTLSNEPLHPLEIHRYDTYFELHPEKIAGKQVASTSYSFPVITKGTEQDIKRVIEQGIAKLQNKPKPEAPSKQLQLIKIKAKAAKAKLLLLEL